MFPKFPPPSPPFLTVKFPNGCASFVPVLFVLFLEYFEESIRRRLARSSEFLDPSGKDLRVAKRSKLLKSATRRFPHALPVARRIDVPHDLRNENAAAQGDA
jgi:hypothetical protein